MLADQTFYKRYLLLANNNINIESLGNNSKKLFGENGRFLSINKPMQLPRDVSPRINLTKKIKSNQYLIAG